VVIASEILHGIVTKAAVPGFTATAREVVRGTNYVCTFYAPGEVHVHHFAFTPGSTARSMVASYQFPYYHTLATTALDVGTPWFTAQQAANNIGDPNDGGVGRF